MTKWISVEDRLPNTGIDVWILPFEGEPGYSVNSCAGCYYGDLGWMSVYSERIATPTHWAEIEWPEPPEEAE